MSSISQSKPVRLVDVTGLTAALKTFAADRNWDQFHSPKNLVMALTGEIGELSEIFQWMTEAESEGAALNPETAQKVRDEKWLGLFEQLSPNDKWSTGGS